MMPAVYNTKKSGYFHYIIYKEKGDEYVGVCLDFDLVEYGLDPKELEKSIIEAASSYLKSVRKKNLPDEYLNLPPKKKHLDKLREIEMERELIRKTTGRRVNLTEKKLSYFTNTKAPYYGNNVIA